MKAFEYHSVRTMDETCAILAENGPDACVLAGGTDLLIELRRPGVKKPTFVVDISRIDELSGISESDGSIIVGPLTTHTQLMKSNLLRQHAPLLASAASTIGSPQIRNRGTIGGNIMNAAACADTVPALIALGSSVTLRSTRGTRRMDLVDLFVRPYQTCARSDEVLAAIQFPKLPRDSRGTFIKLGRRNALSISRLSVASVIQVESDGRIGNAIIVPGAAFPTWRRVPEAEHLLIGEKPSTKLFALAGARVSDMMIARTGKRWSTEYKTPVLAVLVRRALAQCVHPADTMKA